MSTPGVEPGLSRPQRDVLTLNDIQGARLGAHTESGACVVASTTNARSPQRQMMWTVLLAPTVLGMSLALREQRDCRYVSIAFVEAVA
jgi:hypothetical protein